jgi:hypothetical protein
MWNKHTIRDNVANCYKHSSESSGSNELEHYSG